nr:reverse transcriptase domain-containing protein [Tanacetum cinerariifolium]
MIECMSDGALYYLDRIWVPLKGYVRTLIIDEAHKSKYSIHPGADKMYYDLRDRYWWLGIKKDIVVYERIAMEFVTKLPRTISMHDTIWVIVVRLTKSDHFLPMRGDLKMDRWLDCKEQENAFQTLKDKLCNAPVLALPDGLEDFVVYCDASGLGLGCVLMKRDRAFSDYDCEIHYHPCKANVVADALSRKERVTPKRIQAMNMTLQSSIKDRILAAQEEAFSESAGLQKGLDNMIECMSDGALYYLDRIWVPLKGDVRTLIIDEAHKSKYSIHPGADKMYYDLRDRVHLAYCSNLRFLNGNKRE